MTTIDGIDYALDTPVSGEATITGPDTTTLDTITVPATIDSGGNTYFVTKIASAAFRDNTTITSIDFSGATNLKIIDGNAFNNTPVTSLDFTNLENLEQVYVFSFRYCTELTSVTFFNNPKLIGSGSNFNFAPFDNCSNLPTIDLSNTVIENIGNNSFNSCSNLISVKLPSSLTRISNSAFDSTGLTEILIPYTVDTIVGYAFENFVTNFVLYWDEAYKSELDTYVDTAFSSSSTGLKVVYLNTTLGSLAPKLQKIQDDYPSDKTIYYSPFILDAPDISTTNSAASINLDGTTSIITFRLIFPSPFTAPTSGANDVSSYIVTETLGGATIISQPSTPQSQYNGYTFLFGDLDDSNTTITVHTTNNFPSSGTIIIENEFISYTGTTSTTFTGCTRGAFGSTAAEHDSKTTVYEAVIITFTAEQGPSSFQFQVQATAINDEGISVPSGNSNILTTPGIPGKATDASKTYRTVTLQFTEPASPGAEITGYAVEASSGGVISYPDVSVETAPGVSPARILIEGLTGETEYTFKIKAINNIGESDYSVATDPITTVTPEPPAIPVLSSTDSAEATGINTATLEFAEPNDNGSDITEYDVKANGNDISQSNLSYTIGALPFIINIDGLTPNTSYIFTVQARNIKGGDGYSNNSNEITTDKAAPDVPENVDATASMLDSSVATLEFAEPNYNGKEITVYDVKANGNDISQLNLTYTLGVSPVIITVNELEAETTYTFKVQASNSYGPSGYSDASNEITTIAANTFRIRNIIYEIIFDPPKTDTGNVTIIGTYDVPSSWHAVVPATVDDINSNPYNVISVSDQAFYNLTDLTTITFTSTTTTFGSQCFYKCTALTSINVPSVSVMGTSCFYGCTTLGTTGTISLPVLTTLSNGIFRDCTGLETISIPQATTLNSNCFYNCQALTTIDLINVNTMANSCFDRCGNLVSLTNTNSVQTIGNNCFRSCAKLNTDLPINVQTLGNYCFYQCNKLDIINIPQSITSIGTNCFQYCNSINTVNMVASSSITSLPNYIFSDCTGLSTITNIPTAITSFGEYCFQKTPLSAIIIPENVTTIGQGCFINCDVLTRLNFPVGVTVIEPFVAQSCNELEEVDLPGVTETNNACFNGCNKLTTISAPELLTVNNNTFSECAILTTISLPKSTYLEHACFYKCPMLSSVSIPNLITISNTSGDELCFGECTSLETISFPKATTIGNSCFKDCTSLTSVSLNKAETFGTSCFKGCTSLEEIIMHDNVTSLGTSCFEGCTSLIKMLWKNQLALTTIGTDIFSDIPTTNNMIVTYENTVDPDIDPDSLSEASKQLQDNDYPGTTTYIYLSKPSPCIVNDIIATGPTTVSIIFTSPSYTGNSPITSYTATSTPGNITSTLYVNKSINDDINTTMNMERAIQLTIYITGLTPNTTYTFVMHTFNAYGRSDPSNIFNPVTTDPEPTPNPNPNPVPEPSLTMFNIRRSRASYGQFWFGKSIGFPGFLYKKNNGVGGRRSTKSAPGGNSNCNTYQNVNNSYTPGSGVGGSSIAVRRAKRKYATIQTTNQYL